MTEPGTAYDAVLIAGLREHVFDLEDYDAEAAAQVAAAEVPQLSKFVRQMIADNDDTREEDQT
jgi:hypothetical protein